MIFRICGGCHQEIGLGHYLSGLGTLWHPQCFRCYECGLPIREKEVVSIFYLRHYNNNDVFDEKLTGLQR